MYIDIYDIFKIVYIAKLFLKLIHMYCYFGNLLATCDDEIRRES